MNYVSLSGNDLVQLAQTGDAGAVGELQRRNAKGSRFAAKNLATLGVSVNIDSPTPQEQTVMNITPQSGAAPVAQNPAPCVNTSTSEDLIALITQQVIAALTQQPLPLHLPHLRRSHRSRHPSHPKHRQPRLASHLRWVKVRRSTPCTNTPMTVYACA